MSVRERVGGEWWNEGKGKWESDKLYQTRVLELTLHGMLAHSLRQSTASVSFWPAQLPASVLPR